MYPGIPHAGRILTFLCGCAAVAAGQSAAPPELLLLTRIKQAMRTNLRQLPNYTCLETIERSRRAPRSMVISRGGGPGPFLRQDIIRLEVAEVGAKELFSWPGARDFTEKDITDFSRGGMIGNGDFALHARSIFLTDVATYQFAGEENVDGRKLVRFDYRVPYLLSGYILKTAFGEAKMAYYGSFWADPRTLSAVRVDVRADEIPPHLRVSSAMTRIDYARVRIGASDALLPQGAELTIHQLSDYEDRNRISFTHCKQFGAESLISFDESAPVADTRGSVIELPAGLRITIALETPIDLQAASEGDLISGRVLENVKYKGSVLVPKGALVSGRMRRLETYTEPAPYFIAGLEFSEIAFTGHRARFFTAMERVVAPPGLERIEKIPAPNLPGVATLSVKGGRLPAGLRIVWKTMSYDQDLSPRRDDPEPRFLDHLPNN